MDRKACTELLKTLFSLSKKSKKSKKPSEGNPDILSNKQKIFLSFCYGSERARTVIGVGDTLESAFESAKNAAISFMVRKEILPKWVMIDIVIHETALTVGEYYQKLKDTRRGYLRYGVSFDEFYDTAFLEQEIYGNSLIKYIKKNEQYFNIDNIKNYMKRHKGRTFNIEIHDSVPITLFETESYFYDEGDYYEIESSPDSLFKGIRNISFKSSDKDSYEETGRALLELTNKTANALVSTLKENGQFVYGYYPCFNVAAPGYNMPRHSLAIYALADMYLISSDPKYKEAALRALDFMLDNFVHYQGDHLAFILDHINENEVEIKLGAQAMAILAITKCMEIAGNEDKYMPILYKLGDGILFLQNNETGNYTHVLSYPSMEIKDEFRIVYYAGEACFALTRLYTVDRNPKWLDSIERAFDFFMQNGYHKYSDHWLAYAINELTLYKDDDKYFEFGLKNAFYDLDYVIKRDTTWNTFLEMVNASFMMIKKIQDLNKGYLLKSYDLEKLHHAMEVRFERQLASIMFPEMAMFFKSPETILHGIFIRHQSFRVRNDDIAHHLMGYSNYYRYNFLEATLQQRWNKKAEDIDFVHSFILDELNIYYVVLTEKHVHLEGSVEELARKFEVSPESFYGFLMGIAPMVSCNLSKLCEIKTIDTISVDLDKQGLYAHLEQKPSYAHLLDLEAWRE